MNTETFNKLLDELDGNSLETLKQKNAKYASADDCLHNFESGAEIMGSTPAQCAWGYMTKHLVALRDKVEKDDFSDRDDLLEKCQDIINYIRFIWLIGNDREATNVMDEVVEDLGHGVDDETVTKFVCFKDGKAYDINMDCMDNTCRYYHRCVASTDRGNDRAAENVMDKNCKLLDDNCGYCEHVDGACDSCEFRKE